MNKKIKFLGCLALTSTILLGAAGCGKSKEPASQNNNEPQKIIIGMDDAFPPMEFRDASNNLQGFDIDVTKELEKKLNVKFEYLPTEWKGVIQSLKSKRFDIIFSALSVTEERQKEILFSNPYLIGKQIVVARKDDSTITIPENLKGKMVGVQLGSSAEAAMNELAETTKEVKKYDKNTDALQDLAIGRIDAVVVDELVGRYYIKEQNDKYKVLDKALASEPVAVGFRKEDTALKEKFDKALEELKMDGTMEKISKKWFGEDITK
jgi:polar amino acid transport system substrate-binding protein